LRGLAALGVVFCHFGSNLSSYRFLSKVFNFGQTGVYVFFLISGFIIVYSLVKSNYRYKQFFTFLLKRSIRIDPSYFVVILLTIILFKLLVFIPSYKGNGFTFIPGQFIAHIFYVVPFTKYEFYNHVFWTLSVEFQFYLIVGMFFFLSESRIYRSIFLILFSLLSLINWPNSYYLVFNYSPIFSTGIALVTFYKNKNWINVILPICFLVLVAFKFGIAILILLIISSIVILYHDQLIKPLRFLGDISYSLYLTHTLVLIVCLGLIKRLSIDVNQHQLFWLSVEILIAIAFAYFFYRLIEKPSINLSKKYFYKKR